MPIFRRRSSRAAEQAAKDQPPSLPELKPDLSGGILSARSAADLRQRFLDAAEVKPESSSAPQAQPLVAPAQPAQKLEAPAPSQPLRRSPSGRPLPPEGSYSSSAGRVPIAVPAVAAATSPSAGAASSPGTVASSGSATFPRAYHRPWTREGISPATFGSSTSTASPGSNSTTTFPMQQSNSASGSQTSSGSAWQGSPAKHRPPPSSYKPIPASASWASDPGLPAPSSDFRVSPFAIPAPSPNARKQAHEAARKMSLRRAKAPQTLNLLVMGARGAGKTSWIRTLVSTLDLSSVSSEEERKAIALFGLAGSATHRTRRTNPATPLTTKSYTTLPTIELPVGGLLSSLGDASSPSAGFARPMSAYSTASSFMDRSESSRTIGAGSSRLLLSITDTDGFDWVLDDEFDTERRVLRALRYVEDKLSRTLNEESKVKRRTQFESHVDAILYFIDPLHLIERTLMRKSDREKAKVTRVRESMSRRKAEEQRIAGAAVAAGAAPTSDPRKRSASNPQAAAAGLARSTSESSALHKGTHTRKRSISQGRVSGMRVNGVPSSRPPPPPPIRATTADGSSPKPFSAALSSPRTPTLNVQRKEVDPAALELAREMEAAGAASSNIDEAETLDDEGEDDGEEDHEGSVLSLAPQELKIISRLADRATVIPVIAKSDLLTAERLEEVREAVKRSWKEAGISWGPFEPPRPITEDETPTRRRRGVNQRNPYHPSQQQQQQQQQAQEERSEADEQASEPGVKLIRIRSRRSFGSGHPRRPSFGATAAADGYGSEEGSSSVAHDSQAGGGGGAWSQLVPEDANDLFKLLPLAVFAPEPVRVELPAAAAVAASAAVVGHQRNGSNGSAKSLARKVSNVVAQAQQQQGSGAAAGNGAAAKAAASGSVDLTAVAGSAAELDSTPGVPPRLGSPGGEGVPPVPKIPKEIVASLAGSSSVAQGPATTTTTTTQDSQGATTGGLASGLTSPASHTSALASSDEALGVSLAPSSSNAANVNAQAQAAAAAASNQVQPQGAGSPAPSNNPYFPSSSTPSVAPPTHRRQSTSTSLRPLTATETTRLLRAKKAQEDEAYLLSLPARFERSYRWGSCSVLDPKHCDFVLLRTLLLGSHLEGIKEETRSAYERFRERRLEERRSTREMSEAEHGKLLRTLDSL